MTPSAKKAPESSHLSLKTQNLPLLAIFIAFELYLSIQLMSPETEFKRILPNISNQSLHVLSSSLLMPILSLILSSVISSKLKMIIIFWKIKNPEPGCRVFSQNYFDDPRVNRIKAAKQFTGVEGDPLRENATWYKYYKKHENAKIVKSSHRNFLLLREMTAISIFAIVVYLLVSFILHSFQLWSLALLLVQYLILCMSARNVGRRFCLNVIVESLV